MKSIIIKVLGLFALIFVIHSIDVSEINKKKIDVITLQAIQIDSLKNEIHSLQMSVDYLDFVIEQAKEKNPKEIEKILNESE